MAGLKLVRGGPAERPPDPGGPRGWIAPIAEHRAEALVLAAIFAIALIVARGRAQRGRLQQ